MAKTKKTQKEAVKATALLRKGTLAYIGLYGAAYERAKFRVEQVRGATDGLFDTLIVKGEEIEGKATEIAKGAQVKATETFTATTSKVRGVLQKKPTAKKVKTEKVVKEIVHTKASLAKMLEKDVVALANHLAIIGKVLP